MLRVTVGYDEVEVRFDHKLCGSTEIHDLTGICVEESRRCSIVAVSLNGRATGHGMAVCHPADNFCRSIGRKKALVQALSSFPKRIRTAVWGKYKENCIL